MEVLDVPFPIRSCIPYVGEVRADRSSIAMNAVTSGAPEVSKQGLTVRKPRVCPL